MRQSLYWDSVPLGEIEKPDNETLSHHVGCGMEYNHQHSG